MKSGPPAGLPQPLFCGAEGISMATGLNASLSLGFTGFLPVSFYCNGKSPPRSPEGMMSRLVTGSSLLADPKNMVKDGEIMQLPAIHRTFRAILAIAMDVFGWLKCPMFWCSKTPLFWSRLRHQINVAWNYQLHQSLFAIERVVQWKVFMDSSKTSRDLWWRPLADGKMWGFL